MAEVDRTVPAQTQQRYVRTDTKCSSSGGGIATPTTTRGDQYIVNNNSQTNCTSTPIYETIVLNQPQRDAAYQQCRSGINNQRERQQNLTGLTYDANPTNPSYGYQPPSPSNQKSSEVIRKYDQQRAKCDPIKDNDAFLKCMREIRQPSSSLPTQPVNNSTQIPPKPLTAMEQAKAKCLDLGFKAGTESFGQCVLKIAK